MTLQPLVLVDLSGSEIEWRFAGDPPKHIDQVRGKAGVDAFKWVAQKLNDVSLSMRIEQEIESLRSEIEDGIRSWANNNPDGLCLTLHWLELCSRPFLHAQPSGPAHQQSTKLV